MNGSLNHLHTQNENKNENKKKRKNSRNSNGSDGGDGDNDGNDGNGNRSRRLSISDNLTDESFSRHVANIGKMNVRGSVEATFDHGCFTTFKSGGKNLRGIAFDPDFIDYLVENKQLLKNPFQDLHSMFQLLHLCNFGYVLTIEKSKIFVYPCAIDCYLWCV